MFYSCLNLHPPPRATPRHHAWLTWDSGEPLSPVITTQQHPRCWLSGVYQVWAPRRNLWGIVSSQNGASLVPAPEWDAQYEDSSNKHFYFNLHSIQFSLNVKQVCDYWSNYKMPWRSLFLCRSSCARVSLVLHLSCSGAQDERDAMLHHCLNSIAEGKEIRAKFCF